MKLLLDANLSWRLITLLKKEFPGILHVNRTGLIPPAPDTLIWNWAKENNYYIVTQDEDFAWLVNQRGFPPKVIILKIGNSNNRFIAELLINNIEAIDAFLQSDELGLMEIIE